MDCPPPAASSFWLICQGDQLDFQRYVVCASIGFTGEGPGKKRISRTHIEADGGKLRKTLRIGQRWDRSHAPILEKRPTRIPTVANIQNTDPPGKYLDIS